MEHAVNLTLTGNYVPGNFLQCLGGMKYKTGVLRLSLRIGVTWRTLKNTKAYLRN